MQTALDWSAYPGAGGGFQGAVEMCNNNGECRKHVAGVMCPSFRVTGNERDVTRGRANSLRLAISGQLGPDAFASDEMLETMKLCVSCKGCRRECPTGVDMAKMKIEVLAAANKRRGLSLHDRLVAYLPRYAPYAARLAPLMNVAQLPSRALPGSPSALPASLPNALCLAGGAMCFARRLHHHRSEVHEEGAREVALFADTFNTYFEPENLRAAVEVLTRLGYRVTMLAADPTAGGRCAAGAHFFRQAWSSEARIEARRMLAAAAPLMARGVPIVGLEPSCLLTLRDEFSAMLPGADTERLASSRLSARGVSCARSRRGTHPGPSAEGHGKVLLHGHCHQKAFGGMAAVQSSAWRWSRA